MRQRAASGGGAVANPTRAEQLLAQNDMLASHEQEEVIAELRSMLVSQSRAWRAVFGALGLALAAAFAWCAAAQAAHPWVSFRHHSGFKETLSAGGLAAAEAASAICLAGSAAALLAWMPAALSTATGGGSNGGVASDKGLRFSPPAETRLLTCALAGAAAMAVFWVRALWAAGGAGLLNPEQQLRAGWLPAAPLAFALLAGTVARQYADSGARLKALEAQMYAHEGA